MNTILQKSQIKKVDEMLAQQLNISSFELMKKAGAAVFSYVQHYRSILIVTGAGNNAGDGFVMAKLAMDKGINILVWNIIAVDKLPKDAQLAARDYLNAGGKITKLPPHNHYDCIIDAIFGTGLSRAVAGKFAQAISWINKQSSQVVAVDIPSGLDADTGQILSCAVHADMTLCVIAYKAGLFTNNGKDVCGEVFLEDLDVDDGILSKTQSQIQLLDKSIFTQELFKHAHNSHKGSFGQALIVGGHDGMLGALILAGRSALQSGCGMVEVVSNSSQSVLISLQCPELITANDIKASRLINAASVIAVGPGLGLNQQSKEVLQHCIKQDKPMVIDADALTLIAGQHQFDGNVVLTPHPKEAAKLLNSEITSIQNDRVSAARGISHKYNAIVVLKGSGTIVSHPDGDVYICPYGYSGMATAGMGDVLTGIVASLMAQGFDAFNAAQTAVVWHAVAAENSNKGNRLIATDVIAQLAQEIS